MWSETTVTYQNVNEPTPAAVMGTVDLRPVGSTTNDKHIGFCQDRNNECISLVKTVHQEVYLSWKRPAFPTLGDRRR